MQPNQDSIGKKGSKRWDMDCGEPLIFNRNSNKSRSADASVRTISAGLVGTLRGNGQEANPGLSQAEYLFGY